MTTAHAATIDTALSPFSTVVNASGEVLAAGWTTDIDQLVLLIHPTLRPTYVVTKGDLGAVTRAARAYHEGDLAAVDAIAVQQVSGEFIGHAWKILRTVKPGQPVTYTEFAELSGRPAAVRAAAGACAKNPAALFVPCHRVLRTDGTLGGFRWGLPAKRWLLDHEAARVSAPVASAV